MISKFGGAVKVVESISGLSIQAVSTGVNCPTMSRTNIDATMMAIGISHSRLLRKNFFADIPDLHEALSNHAEAEVCRPPSRDPPGAFEGDRAAEVVEQPDAIA